MPKVTILFGALLVIIGFLGFYHSDGKAPTALIPAGFGITLMICGAVALDDHYKKHAMHIAAAVGMLGFLGTFVMIVIRLVKLAPNQHVTSPVAFYSQGVTCVLSGIFLAMCVRSFLAAKKARLAKAAEEAKAGG
jgi:hypothetical protein